MQCTAAWQNVRVSKHCLDRLGRLPSQGSWKRGLALRGAQKTKESPKGLVNSSCRPQRRNSRRTRRRKHKQFLGQWPINREGSRTLAASTTATRPKQQCTSRESKRLRLFLCKVRYRPM